jgi:arylsulfatase A-like enzyme
LYWAAFFVVPWSWAQSAPPKPPNVVLIVADDLGWTDAGFAGSRFYETPHLDAMAAGGMRLTSFYAAPVGLPTHAEMLSGQYSPRTLVDAGDIGDAGATGIVATVDFPVRTNLAAVLKGAGYATGFMGTWGFNREGEAQPTRLGFDEAVLTSPQHVGFDVHPPAEVPAGTYLVDFLTERALDFLDRHREKPFFLMLSHFSVHQPTDPKPAWVGRFEKKPPAGGHRDAAYAAMIGGLDEGVGRVIARIESLNLTGNTVVIFLSDNGGVGMQTDAESGGRRTGVTDNAPLRGGKGTIYEGGMRVPFLVRWPGVVAPGSRSSDPVAAVDLFPTLCEVAGTRPPAGQPVDGANLLPLWKNAAAHLGRDALFWHFPDGLQAAGRPAVRTPPVGVVRAGNFKLIEWLEDGRVELYNVVEDLGEKNNLVRSLPEKTSELKAKLAAWRKETSAPLRPVQAPTAPPTAPAPVPAPVEVPATNAPGPSVPAPPVVAPTTPSETPPPAAVAPAPVASPVVDPLPEVPASEPKAGS